VTSTSVDTWRPPYDDALLGADEVHVWRASVDEVGEAWFSVLESFLSSNEIERAGRYRFDKDRRRFVARRGLLRLLLSRYAGAVPTSFRFNYNSFGKPYLDDEANRPASHFNVSQSHGLALFAFSTNRELGVDIEQVKPLNDQESVAQRFFAPGEIQAIRSLPEDMQTDALYRCWTRKEAYIKGVVKGLSIPLDSFEVSLGEASAALLRTDDSLGRNVDWSLYPLIPGQGFAGALAVQGKVSKIELFDGNIETVLITDG
jgi:4'-phosphopantetheinyl transferase